jgi:hypothetical protein
VFPTQEAVAKLAAAPSPSKLLDDKGKDVPTWELAGPLPDALDRVPPADDSPWGQLFAAAVAARGDAVVATEAMHCVARENAAFYLANDASPAEMLRRFIAARCGAPNGIAGTAINVITGDPRAPDEKIFEHFKDKVRDGVDKTLQAGRIEAGMAYVRKGGKAVIAVSVVPQTVRLDKTPLTPGPDGKVVLKGEVPGNSVGLRALINQGKFGYAECAVSPAVRLPRFMITCQAARDDEVAWISVSALPPGRVLGEPVLEMMVWPSGAPGKTYAKLARPSGEAPTASLEDMTKEINRIRAEAKLPPVRLADQQSRTATLLAPHYFGNNDREAVADQVALGLLAGWQVDGMVRTGHFVSTWVTDAVSGAEVVRAAMSRPIGRAALLDPTIERVAIGPLSMAGGQGALFSTYALFDTYRHDEDAKHLVSRIAAVRQSNGVSPPKLFTDLSDLARRAAETVQAGSRAPEEALDDLLKHVANDLGRSARGWVVETTSLDRISFPSELVASPSAGLGIGVAHHRRQGQPWGRFVVLVVMVDEGGGAGPQTAMIGGTSG